FIGASCRGKPRQRFGAERHVAANQQAVGLFVLERGRKRKEVQRAGQAFYGIVQISCRLRIFADHQVVQLTRAVLLENSADKEGRGAALKILTNHALELGQEELSRQLKQAGRRRRR